MATQTEWRLSSRTSTHPGNFLLDLPLEAKCLGPLVFGVLVVIVGILVIVVVLLSKDA
jgi:hypothetical protein